MPTDYNVFSLSLSFSNSLTPSSNPLVARPVWYAASPTPTTYRVARTRMRPDLTVDCRSSAHSRSSVRVPSESHPLASPPVPPLLLLAHWPQPQSPSSFCSRPRSRCTSPSSNPCLRTPVSLYLHRLSDPSLWWSYQSSLPLSLVSVANASPTRSITTQPRQSYKVQPSCPTSTSRGNGLLPHRQYHQHHHRRHSPWFHAPQLQDLRVKPDSQVHKRASGDRDQDLDDTTTTTSRMHDSQQPPSPDRGTISVRVSLARLRALKNSQTSAGMAYTSLQSLPSVRTLPSLEQARQQSTSAA